MAGALSVSDIKDINECLEQFKEELNTMGSIEEVFPYVMGEPEEEGTPNDELGIEFDLDDALDDNDIELSNDDIVDRFLMDLVDEIGEIYEEESAIEAMQDAVSSLIDDGSIEDIPAVDESEEEKARWIHNSMGKIRERLREFGVELETGAETTGGLKY